MSTQGNTLQWSSTEVFEISGYELETMMNMLINKLANKESQEIIREYEALKMLQNRVQEGVTSGKVKVNNIEDVNIVTT